MPPELQELRRQEALRARLLSNKATFPGYHEEIQMLVVEGDFIARR